MKQLTDIIKHITYSELYINNQSITITGINYNSGLCKQNNIFVAIQGEKLDGHTYIKDAIEKGASVVICEKLPNIKEEPYNNASFIVVNNSRLALAEISNVFYNFPTNKLKVIGITGTNGKTTTTFLLKSILEEAGKKVGMIGTTGIFIGNQKIEATHTTPESLELMQIFTNMLENDIEYVIMEISSHSLILNRVAKIKFIAAAFTNLTPEHLDFHKTMINYAKAKKILFDNLDKEALAIINANDEYAPIITNNTNAKKILFANKSITKEQLDKHNNYNSIAYICNEKLQIKYSTFSLNIDNNCINFKINIPAYFNIENAATAILIAYYLNINIKTIQDGLAKSYGAPGRLDAIHLNNNATVYIDYSHTPDALEKALKTCKMLLNTIDNNLKTNLICVFGCGGDRDKTKRPIMGKIAAGNADYIIITDDNPRTENNLDIINDIKSGIDSIKNRNNILVIPDREQAIKKAIEISKENDIILIAGKGHEDYQIIGTTKIHFSDKEIVLKYK